MGAQDLNFLLESLDLVSGPSLLFGKDLCLLLVLLRALEEVASYSVDQVLSVDLGPVQILNLVHIVADPNGQWLQLSQKVFELRCHLYLVNK